MAPDPTDGRVAAILAAWEDEYPGGPGCVPEYLPVLAARAIEALTSTAPCPYVVTADGGTSHCRLAESHERRAKELPYPSTDCANCRAGVCGGHVGPYSMPVRSAGGGDQPDTPCPTCDGLLVFGVPMACPACTPSPEEGTP